MKLQANKDQRTTTRNAEAANHQRTYSADIQRRQVQNQRRAKLARREMMLAGFGA